MKQLVRDYISAVRRAALRDGAGLSHLLMSSTLDSQLCKSLGVREFNTIAWGLVKAHRKHRYVCSHFCKECYFTIMPPDSLEPWRK
eukprot:883184-Amphidinium_carterae.2